MWMDSSTRRHYHTRNHFTVALVKVGSTSQGAASRRLDARLRTRRHGFQCITSRPARLRDNRCGCGLTGCIILSALVIVGVEWATSTPSATKRKMSNRSRSLTADAIGPVEAAAQSFGTMSPIMAVSLVTPIIAGGAGLATPAAVLLACVASILCGRTIAAFASRWPSAGSLLTYTTVSLGPAWGVFSGITYAMAMTLLTVGGVAFLAKFAKTFFGFYHPFSGLFLGCVISLSVGVVCLLGVRVSTRIQLAVTIGSALLVVLLGLDIIVVRFAAEASAGTTMMGGRNESMFDRAGSGAGIFPGVFARLLESLSPTTAPSFSGFCKALLSALLIFAGYESAASFSERPETRQRPYQMQLCLLSLFVACFTCGYRSH